MRGGPAQMLGDALARYRGLPRMARLHLYVRAKTCPFGRLEALVPREGLIYDIGCGHGIFSVYMALSSPRRRVVGWDLSAEKIALARGAGRGIPNLEFRQGDATGCDLAACDAVVILDVLYLINNPTCSALTAKCYARLGPGGVLIVKDMDTRPRWKYLWAHAQEILAVKVLGITMGHSLHFRGRDEFVTLLGAPGFSVTPERLDRGYMHPHIVYLCLKQR